MHKILLPRDDFDRLYGKGIASIKDSVDASIQRLEDYIKKCRGRLITATLNNTDKSSIIRIKITRRQQWEEKQLFWHFKRQTSKISHEKTWTWLRKGNLKRETEALLIAAQNNAIRTNYLKTKIYKTQQNRRCRLCGDGDETINLIISECCKLAPWLGGEGVLLEIVQEVWIWPYEHMVYVQPRIHPRKWDAQNSLVFWDRNGSSNLGQTNILVIVKKRKTLQNYGLCRFD